MVPVISNLRDMRATPVDVLNREFWSKGIPALPGTPRGPRVTDLDPSDMTLEQLVATQDSDLPTIARAAWLAGARVDSIDMVSDDGTDTLAETIPSSHPAYDHLVTLMPLADMTPEQRAAYDGFCADFAYKGGSVPYAIEDPAVRQRIEWERHMRLSSDVGREGLRPAPTGDRMQFYSLIGRRLDRTEFIARKEAFVKAFLARTGLDAVPDAATFAKKRAVYAMARNVDLFAEAREAGIALDAAFVPEVEPEDEDAAASREVVESPYLPSLSLFIYQAELATPALPDDATEAQQRRRRRAVVLAATREHRIWSAWNDHEAEEAPADDRGRRGVQIAFRSARDIDRYHRGNRDALYHSTLVEAEVDPPVVTLGFAN